MGAHERSCHECQADLTAPGSVRLADPRRVKLDINGQPIGPANPPPPAAGIQPVPAFDAPAAPPAATPVLAAGASPAAKAPGTGWWAALRGRALQIGEQARMANQARAAARPTPPQPPPPPAPPAVVPVPTGPGSGVQLPPAGVVPTPLVEEHQINTVVRDDDPDRTVIRNPEPPVAASQAEAAHPVSSATPVRPPQVPAMPTPVLPAPGAEPPTESDPDKTVIRPTDPDQTVLQPEDTDRTVLRAPVEIASTAQSAPPAPRGRRRRAENDLNLWDDYGIADAGQPIVDPDASRSVQAAQLLGASALPMAKVLAFLAVLVVTILALITLVTRLITLDTLVATGPTSAAPPSAQTLPPSAPESTAEPSGTESAPADPVTPSMLPGAKECDAGVWAGPQTSCALANTVGQQVDRGLAETTVIEAFSNSSNRNYRLECVPGQGITCTGLDGVEGVYVWLVTQG